MKTTIFIKEENPTLFIRQLFLKKLYKSIQATNKSTSLKNKRNNMISCN